MTSQFEDRFGNEVPRPAQRFLDLITESVNAGLTQSEIQARIREVKDIQGESPTGIRDDYLRQAIRYVRGEENINPPPQYKYIEHGKSPDPQRLRQATGTTTRRFAYRVAIVDTGADEERHSGFVSLSSSQRLSRQQILDEAWKMIDQRLEQYVSPIPNQYRLDIVDALVSNDFLLSAGDNFAA